MMKAATALTDRVEEAWDHYCSENYSEILSMKESDDLRELRILARLETDILYRRNADSIEIKDHGPFSGLLHAMKLYHSNRYDSAANELGKWFITKGYYSQSILERFTDSCYRARQFDLLFTVSSKMIKAGNEQSEWIEACLSALYELGKYKEGARLFNRFQSKFRETTSIHKAALCLFHSEEFAKSEALLLSLHEKLTGKKYRDGYEEAKKRYEGKIKNLSKLEKSSKTEQEKMELGMVYLFSGKYEKAIEVFQSLIRSSK